MKEKMINLKELSKEALISMLEERDRKFEKAVRALEFYKDEWKKTVIHGNRGSYELDVLEPSDALNEDQGVEARKALTEIRGGGEG